MTATDRLGFPVTFGDYVMVSDVKLSELATLTGTVVRIVKISETPKGVAAVGAYVDLVGTGRVSRIPVDIAASRLVMRSNGDALVGGGEAPKLGRNVGAEVVDGHAAMSADGTEAKDDGSGDGPALGEKSEPEGGRANSRTSRRHTA